MDRRTVLERLDAVRPGSDDLSLPEMAEAGDALERDSRLAEAFDRLQEWDGRIAVAMQDVPVPADLKDRLLSRLADSEATTRQAARRHSRRRVLAIVSGLAASLVAGGLFWAATSTEPVTVAEMRDAAGALLSRRAVDVPFDGGFEPRLPSGSLRTRLRFSEPAVGLLDQRVAAWRFTTGGRRPLQGVLAVTPVENVATPPEADSIFDREYVAAGNAVAWKEGDFVYVCYVDGGIDDLLRRLGDGPLA